jgi:hypothetical protein
MGPLFSDCNFFLLFSLLRKGFHLWLTNPNKAEWQKMEPRFHLFPPFLFNEPGTAHERRLMRIEIGEAYFFKFKIQNNPAIYSTSYIFNNKNHQDAFLILWDYPFKLSSIFSEIRYFSSYISRSG